MTTSIKAPVRPEMATVLEAVKRSVKLEMHCVQIGVIKSFAAGTQLATIEIAMKQIIEISEDGTKVFQEYPLLLECPVMTLFGGNSFINLPIQPGDNCIVLFNDRDIDTWVNNGPGASPTTSRLHDISDAIAIVGIRPLTNSIPNFLGSGIRIYMDGQNSIDLTSAGITINADQVTINSNVTINGILRTDYAGTQIEYNTHTHSGVVPGGGNTGQPNDI